MPMVHHFRTALDVLALLCNAPCTPARNRLAQSNSTVYTLPIRVDTHAQARGTTGQASLDLNLGALGI